MKAIGIMNVFCLCFLNNLLSACGAPYEDATAAHFMVCSQCSCFGWSCHPPLHWVVFISYCLSQITSISCGGGRNFPRWRSFEYSILQNPSSLGCWSNWGNNGCTTPSTWRVPLAAEAHLGGWCSFSARVAEEVGYLFLTFFNTWHLMAISLTEGIRKQISRVKMCGAFFPCRGSFVVISCSLVCLKLMCIIHKV